MAYERIAKGFAPRFLMAMLAVAVLLAVFGALPAFASTFTVMSTADSGTGSLRAAIASATLSNSNDTIEFQTGLTGTILLTSGTLPITTSLTITGPGASSLAISGNNAAEVFSIVGAITVKISGLTIENGNASSGSGGGISNTGTLTVTDCSVTGNMASEVGGGIYNTGTLTVTNSNVSGNTTTGFGGGINNSGALNVNYSNVSGNSGYDGGGIFTGGTMTTLTGSTVSGNSSSGSSGAGIFNGGPLTVNNSTISGNSFSVNYGSGGGIYNDGGPMTITNSTISGNSASATGGQGGGIYNAGYTPASTVTSSTLSGNSAAAVAAGGGGGNVFSGGPMAMIFRNSILANASTAAGGNCSEGTTGISSQGYNLSDDTTCSSFFNKTGEDVNNPMGGAGLTNILQNNGGPTQTIALFSNSPAVDVIPVSSCVGTNQVPTDQREVPRPQAPNSNCDIGAYELQTLEVDAWGYNLDGELGNGTTTASPTPIPVVGSGGAGLLSNVVAVAAGGKVSLALRSDGTVWAWGDNTFGELGNGTLLPVNSPTPAQVGVGTLPNIVAIAAGDLHGLALASNGTVWAWGDNYYGQLGNGAATFGATGNIGIATPVMVVASSAIATACNGSGITALTKVVAITGGLNQSMALKDDGTVWAWGYDDVGELGTGAPINMNYSCAPLQVVGPGGAGTSFLANVAAIASGERHSMALTGDGSVWDWGYGTSGQLGNGSTNAMNYTPVQVVGSNSSGLLSGVTAIAGGGFSSSALLGNASNGTVWDWGLNYYGQLGNGSATTNTACNCIDTPVQVVGVNDSGELTGVAAISGGEFFNLALVPTTMSQTLALFSEDSVALGSAVVGSPALTQTLQLENEGATPMTASSVTIDTNGPYFNQFFISSASCMLGSSVPSSFYPITMIPGDTCSFVVGFTPEVAGPVTGVIDFTETAASSNVCPSTTPGSPATCTTGTGGFLAESIPVTGTGTGTPSIYVVEQSANFPNQTVGVRSAATVINLENTGSVPVYIADVGITGTNAADFAETNTCLTASPAPSPLPPTVNDECAITVSFTPSTTTAESASLIITNSASPLQTNIPVTGIPLTENGVVPTASAPATVSFGLQLDTQAVVGVAGMPMAVTLKNTGTAGVLTPITPTITPGPNAGDFVVNPAGNAGTCGSTLGPGLTCTINVTFAPTAAIPSSSTGGVSESATLSIADNASQEPQTVMLSGTGVPFTFAGPPPSLQTIVERASAMFTIDVTVGPGSGTLTFSCSGLTVSGTLVAGAACSFNPPSIMQMIGATQTAVPVMVTITTTAGVFPERRPKLPLGVLRRWLPLSLIATILLLGLWMSSPTAQKRRARAAWAFLALVVLCGGWMAACSSSSSGGSSTAATQVGMDTFTITAKLGNLTETINVVLNVTQ